MKKALFVFSLISLSLACGTETSDNTSMPVNRPQTKQFNSQPLDNKGKPIPGIPDPKNANISNRAPGATPTPGIPAPDKVDVTNKKGTTPTPGIPDEATRKKIIEELKKNPNAVNTASDKPPAGKTTKRGPINRPRKVGDN